MRALSIFLVAAAIVSTLLARPAEANRECGWTISASSTDPAVHWAYPRAAPGTVDLYVWYACNGLLFQLAAAEMGIGGTLTAVSFTPRNGFLNAGTATELLLVPPVSCAQAPMLAGVLTVQDPGGGGTVCIVPSSNNRILSVGCDGSGYAQDWVGFASDGTTPCYDVSLGDAPCGIYPPSSPPTGVGDAMEWSSWGGVKALYR